MQICELAFAVQFMVGVAMPNPVSAACDGDVQFVGMCVQVTARGLNIPNAGYQEE